MIIVLALTADVAEQWAQERGLPRASWRFARSRSDLLGYRDITLGFASGHELHPEAAEIRKEINNIRKKGGAVRLRR